MDTDPAPADGTGRGVEIDVVVVTWEGRDLLASCLAHLAASTVAHRVVVVDNGSTDGTVELLRAEHPDVTVVALAENVGFGAGTNRGVQVCGAPYVVLVNNDVDVAPTCLERAVAPLRADDGVGAVAALTTRPGTGVVDQFGISLDAGRCAYPRGAGQDPDRLQVGPLAAPCAGLAAYRRTAYEECGGFDAALFAYSEDLDLGLRLLAGGWRVAEAADARGVHLGGATAGVGSPFQRRLASFGRGFVVGRYRAPGTRGWVHGLVVDLAVVLAGLARTRTAVPAVQRWRGYRAGRSTPRRALPPGVVDPAVGLGEALRRLVG